MAAPNDGRDTVTQDVGHARLEAWPAETCRAHMGPVTAAKAPTMDQPPFLIDTAV